MYTLLLRRVPPPIEAMKSSDPDRIGINGSTVAERELIHQFCAHGTADSIVAVRPRVDPDWEANIAQLPNRERLQAISYDRLDELRSRENVVLFAVDGGMTQAATLRPLYGNPSWVVSGVTHALCSRAVMRQILLLHLHWMEAHDSLVCTSTAAHVALKNLFAAVQRYLTDRVGQEIDCPLRMPIVPLPVPVPAAAPIPAAAARAALGLAAAPVVFLYLGRFSDRMKGDLAPLLIAFSRVARLIADVALVLAGDDREHQAASVAALAAALGIADRVYIRTDPTASLKASLYSAADVFVSLSDNLQETFGLTLLEAMNEGLPVIASDWSGYRDIVLDGETGLLVPAYWADCVADVTHTAEFAAGDSTWTAAQSVAIDVPATVAAMETLASNPTLRQAMGARGQARARATFSGPSIVGQYEQLWSESMHGRRAAGSGRRSAPQLLWGNYFEAFSHYASDIVSADTAIRISDAGRDIVAGRVTMAAFDGDRSGFERARLIDLLRRMNEFERAPAAALLGTRPERDLRHLMRLAKYGLLEIEPGDPRRIRNRASDR